MLDEELLRSLDRRTDRSSGIVERFIQPTLGGKGTVAVLSEPTGSSRSTGLVICPAFGLEQTYLARVDVQLARTLSAAGFPVLRYHGQGYGDSEGTDDIGLASHLTDAKDAIDVLRSEVEIDEVGLVGARLGGTVAALVADELRLPMVILVAPVTNGRRYMRQFVWSHVIADWTAVSRADPAGRAGPGEDGEGDGDAKGAAETAPLREIYRKLEADGWADIQGFRLTQRSREEISATDLISDIGTFSGSALLVGLSRSGDPPQEVLGLAGRLEEIGADVTVVGIADPSPEAFGRYNLKRGQGAKSDRLSGLSRRIAADTVEWCLARISPGARSA